MEELNLSAAKEEMKRSDWSHHIPKYDRECVSDTPELNSNPIEPKQGPRNESNEWDGEVDLTPVVGITKSRMIEESDRYDEDDEEEGLNREEGEAVLTASSGALKRRVQKLVRSRGDVIPKGERKVQVDLSYLGDPEVVDRTKRVIEDVIRYFTSIPGKVETKVVDPNGCFVFNVTNLFLSDPSVSPGSVGTAATSTSSLNEIGTPQLSILCDNLIKGVLLKPKFEGLPKKILKYGDCGLTKESLARVTMAHPSYTPRELLMVALKLAGSMQGIKRLYTFPELP